MQTKSADQFNIELEQLKSDTELKKYERFFPVTTRGDDEFIGVRMGDVFKLAKESVGMPLTEIEKLLESNVHEARVGAVSIMDFEARSPKVPEIRKKELFDLYLRRHDRINTWDLVDRAAINVIGVFLADKPRDILYTLAKSKFMPERRTAIVSTMYFTMKQSVSGDTFKIAEILLNDKEDLIHKATGWALRTTTNNGLVEFLDLHAAKMPRVMLRYSIEKLTPEQKKHYLAIKAV